jgi:SAM-dependent methyltransferase
LAASEPPPAKGDIRVSEYTLPHQLSGEGQRLALMSSLLDPLEQAHIERLGVGKGWRCLELGAGNGSIAKMLAHIVGPAGHVVASDIDVGFMSGLKAPNLEVRRIDVMQDPLETAHYDFVAARALLHHLPDRKTALARMIDAVKPGGSFLSIEPDMLPCTVVEPESMRAFWRGWMNWSEQAGIDYHVGQKITEWLDTLGLAGVAGEGHTPQFNGGSAWATYWVSTTRELAPSIMKSGAVPWQTLEDFYARYQDPHYWTSVITFIANWGRKPAKAQRRGKAQ